MTGNPQSGVSDTLDYDDCCMKLLQATRLSENLACRKKRCMVPIRVDSILWQAVLVLLNWSAHPFAGGPSEDENAR